MKYLLVLFLITLSFPGRAQFLRADYKKAAELKHRPLAVVLPDPETEASNACDSLHMTWYNDHIADAFEKQWSLSDSIVFISSRKAASIIGSKSHEFDRFQCKRNLMFTEIHIDAAPYDNHKKRYRHITNQIQGKHNKGRNHAVLPCQAEGSCHHDGYQNRMYYFFPVESGGSTEEKNVCIKEESGIKKHKKEQVYKVM